MRGERCATQEDTKKNKRCYYGLCCDLLEADGIPYLIDSSACLYFSSSFCCAPFGVVGADLFFWSEWSSSIVVAFTGAAVPFSHTSFGLTSMGASFFAVPLIEASIVARREFHNQSDRQFYFGGAGYVRVFVLGEVEFVMRLGGPCHLMLRHRHVTWPRTCTWTAWHPQPSGGLLAGWDFLTHSTVDGGGCDVERRANGLSEYGSVSSSVDDQQNSDFYILDPYRISSQNRNIICYLINV